MRRIPFLSILLCAAAGMLMLLPPAAQELLYFDYQQLAGGEAWGLVTGHWIHADPQHLVWNLAGLLVLASLIELQSRKLLLWSIACGMLAVNLLLLSPFSELQRYCGLSGLLITLMGVALYSSWHSSRSPVIAITSALYLLKIALEVYSGQSVFTSISWPPYATAHLAGLLGAPLALVLGSARDRSVQHRITGKNYGHLV